VKPLVVAISLAFVAATLGCGPDRGAGTDAGAVVGVGVGVTGGTTGGAGVGGGAGAGGATTAMPERYPCDDLFGQDHITTCEIEIGAAEWAALESDMVDRRAREAAVPPQDYHPYHALQALRVGGDSIANAMIRLKGQSSWLHAIDGWQPGMPIPKMQFVIAFDQIDTEARFHGLRKIELDMPHNDPSMLRQRLALSFLRDDLALPAQCANSGRLVVNGTYYGLYTNLERPDKSFLKRVFPGQSGGDLWDAGWTLETNEEVADHPRQCLFWGLSLGNCGASPPAIIDADALAAVSDMDASMIEWAGEAMVTDADGYWGGRHNWYLYDHPERGFIWIPHDLDATLTWIARNDVDPVFWWEIRTLSSGGTDPHFLGVVTNPDWLPRYVDAVRRARRAYDVATMLARLDRATAQIADAVAADTHKPFTAAAQTAAAATIRSNLAARAAFIDGWLACIDGGGTDGDGDGAPWCRDCNDNDASRAQGQSEICGDGVDQDCNSLVDDGCAPTM